MMEFVAYVLVLVFLAEIRAAMLWIWRHPRWRYGCAALFVAISAWRSSGRGDRLDVRPSQVRVEPLAPMVLRTGAVTSSLDAFSTGVAANSTRDWVFTTATTAATLTLSTTGGSGTSTAVQMVGTQ